MLVNHNHVNRKFNRKINIWKEELIKAIAKIYFFNDKPKEIVKGVKTEGHQELPNRVTSAEVEVF